MPPKFNLSKKDLEQWIEENKELETTLKQEKNLEQFKEWVKNKQTKFAPGFDVVMTPTKSTKTTVIESEDVELSELDMAFGSTKVS